MKIELLYFVGCPSYRTAQKLLAEALAEENLLSEINLIEIKTMVDAQRWKFVGSPTFRFDGVDPFPHDETDFALGCRVYQTPQGYCGWPTKEMFREALKQQAG